MRAWGVLVVAMTLSVPHIAGAVEGRLGVTAGSQYDSNLFRQEKNEEDDYSFSFSPTLGFSRDEGRFDWDVSYAPSYRDYIRFDERDKWDHVGNVRSSYLLGPRTQLSFFDRVSYTENSPNQEVNPNSPSASDVDTSKRRTLRNVLGLNFNHNFTPRLSMGINGNYLLSDNDGGNRSNFNQFAGNTQLTYAVTRRNTWGVGAGYSWVGFSDPNPDDIFVSAGSSHTIRVFATWSYAFSDTLSFRVNGGPARVIQDRRKQTARVYPGPLVAVDPDLGRPVFRSLNSCLQPDGSFSDPCSPTPDSALVVEDSEVAAKTSFSDAGQLAADQEQIPSTKAVEDQTDTFFAEAQIVKRWRRFTMTGLYRRSQNPESSSGTTSVVDAIQASITYRPDRNWDFAISGGWNKRESTNEQTVQSQFIYGDSGLLGRPADNPFSPIDQPLAQVIGQDFKVSNQGLDVTQWTGAFKASRRITDQFKGTFRFTVLDQDSKSKQDGNTNSFKQYRVSIGFSYEFRPRLLF